MSQTLNAEFLEKTGKEACNTARKRGQYAGKHNTVMDIASEFLELYKAELKDRHCSLPLGDLVRIGNIHNDHLFL